MTVSLIRNSKLCSIFKLFFRLRLFVLYLISFTPLESLSSELLIC